MRNQSPWCSWAAQEPIPTLLFRARRPPRGVQERPIRLWKPPLRRPSFFKGSKRRPRDLPEASRAHLAAILAPFWTNVEAISMRCCHQVGHVSLLKAPSPRALEPRPQAQRNARERLNNPRKAETPSVVLAFAGRPLKELPRALKMPLRCSRGPQNELRDLKHQ